MNLKTQGANGAMYYKSTRGLIVDLVVRTDWVIMPNLLPMNFIHYHP